MRGLSSSRGRHFGIASFVVLLPLMAFGIGLFAPTANAKARKVKPAKKAAAPEYLDWNAIQKLELPRRLAPMPLSTECATLQKEKPLAEKGKPKSKQVRVFFTTPRGNTVNYSGKRVQRVEVVEDTFWWVQKVPASASCLGIPLPVTDFAYGGPKWEGNVKRGTEEIALFMGYLIETMKESDKVMLTFLERDMDHKDALLVGPWRVTEAFDPKGQHRSACHYTGCAIDIALCDWNKGCDSLPGQKQSSGGGIAELVDFVPTEEQRWNALWGVLYRMYHYDIFQEGGPDICYAKNEAIGTSRYKKGKHLHIEVYPCRTDYVLQKNKGRWEVYEYGASYAKRVKELEWVAPKSPKK